MRKRRTYTGVLLFKFLDEQLGDVDQTGHC
jgi:hypothetical protein